jgi:hypothetical protein
MPALGWKKPRPQVARKCEVIPFPSAVAETLACTVEVLYVGADGGVERKSMPWKRAATEEAIAAWIEDYEERVASGYRPEGFDVPPMPHCVRVLRGRRVVAEWRR